MRDDGDWLMAARCLDATEAHLLRACLEAAGVEAIVADAHLVQTHSLIAVAVGGARVLVPADQLERAKAVLVAFHRGDFALDDDADVGEAPEAADD
ncbi:putative signal transducing protein [Denitromonas iodatirespirans]|uniref:DUF2007 domain-containing protein n=1 Tax=Denitromonas iodatirespirans TaxID=2795389 RepID=A0A944D799_DENI1|nr:DUF2007 domain-containing protein [Denitromonas iodatirespirans]MBT0959586.1 DUF2007 domain-containing protein [Denitromonas iodatirespirans]